MIQVAVPLHIGYIITCNENNQRVVVLQSAMNFKYYEKNNFVYLAGIAAVCSLP